MIEEMPLSKILKAVLYTSAKPVSIKAMQALFPEGAEPSKDVLETALAQIEASLEDDILELRQLASGYVLQVKQSFAEWIVKLNEEKPPRYSRALLETIAIIAYRQPITRSEIEEIRGVAVSTLMIKTLLERDWIKLLGHRDLPGKPAIYGTTKIFLDYFGLQSLSDLPPIGDIKDLTEDDMVKLEAMLDQDFSEVEADMAIEAALESDTTEDSAGDAGYRALETEDLDDPEHQDEVEASEHTFEV